MLVRYFYRILVCLILANAARKSIGFVNIDAIICITDSVFKVVVTNFHIEFVELLLCRVGWVEIVSLISTLLVIWSDRLYSNYANTNIKRYGLLLNVLLTNVVTKVSN